MLLSEAPGSLDYCLASCNIKLQHKWGRAGCCSAQRGAVQGTVEEKVLELRELQRRPAAGQQAGPQSPRTTAMDAQPGALQVGRRLASVRLLVWVLRVA